MAHQIIDPSIFEDLKARFDEEAKIRQDLTGLCDPLARALSRTQGLLSRVHSTPQNELPKLIAAVNEAVDTEVSAVQALARFASQFPYYRYNHVWARLVQDVISTLLLCAWLGGMASDSHAGEIGRLLTLEDVGEVFHVPVNLKKGDAFHVTLEDYLISLPVLAEELARLAPNAVTHGDIDLAVRICAFVRNLHSGFQFLNLKNDALRKKFDGLKYSVKRAEDVVYDLTLRNMIPRHDAS